MTRKNHNFPQAPAHYESPVPTTLSFPRYRDQTPCRRGDTVSIDLMPGSIGRVLDTYPAPHGSGEQHHGQARIRWERSAHGTYAHGCYLLTPITYTADAIALARSAAAREGFHGLLDTQLVALLAHSEGACARCGQDGLMFLQHTAGFDPTTWHLCAEHHPNPTSGNLDIDYAYADYLSEPAAVSYAEHLRLTNEPHDEPLVIEGEACPRCGARAQHERGDKPGEYRSSLQHEAGCPLYAIGPQLPDAAARAALDAGWA